MGEKEGAIELGPGVGLMTVSGLPLSAFPHLSLYSLLCFQLTYDTAVYQENSVILWHKLFNSKPNDMVQGEGSGVWSVNKEHTDTGEWKEFLRSSGTLALVLSS